MANKVAAYFDNDANTDAAVRELREAGVPDSQIAVLGQHGLDEAPTFAGVEAGVPAAHVVRGAAKGLLTGAGIGAIAGIGAAFFPPLLPFVAIGWLAPITVTAATAGSMALGATAGAILGGTVGTLTGILREADFTAPEAEYYASRLEGGGALVAVELEGGISESAVRAVFAKNGGHYAPEASEAS